MSAKPMLDPRIRRTRRLLQEAVLALAAEQDFVTITIQDIARRAEINRNTFYSHYRDKDDLIVQALDMLFDELTAEDRRFVDAHGIVTADTVPAPLRAVVRHVGERPELYRRLLGENGSAAFTTRLQSYVQRQFLQVWANMGLEPTPSSPPAELRAWFAASSLHGMLSWWLERGTQEEPETVAAWAWTLLAPLWFESTEARAR
jgi:AcrR family transcriptional regulator